MHVVTLSHHRCNREESSRSKITWVFDCNFFFLNSGFIFMWS